MATPSPNQPEQQDSMEAVRDLLFGKKSNEISERFVSLERSLREAVDRVEERVNGRFDSLDQYLRAEAESTQAEIRMLEEKIRSEAAQRESEDRNLSDLMGAMKSSNDDRMTKADQALSEVRDNTRQEIFTQTKRLSDEISDTRRELLKRIENDIAQYAETVSDRDELGGMLIEMGLRIKPGSADEGQPVLELEAGDVEEVSDQAGEEDSEGRLVKDVTIELSR